MAQKEGNPRAIFASDITGSMGDAALIYRNKAPNDKTFSAIILGVNQKFIDDISVEKQAELIREFSIPATLEDGENNYYIFKINGAYYCLQQNGDFKLYDKVVIRIPNGNWSNMFIETSQGGNNVQIPQLFKSVIEPSTEEYQINIGDYWIQLDENDTTKIIALWEYQFNDEQEENEWMLVGNVGGGGTSYTINIDCAILVQRDDVI